MPQQPSSSHGHPIHQYTFLHAITSSPPPSLPIQGLSSTYLPEFKYHLLLLLIFCSAQLEMTSARSELRQLVYGSTWQYSGIRMTRVNVLSAPPDFAFHSALYLRYLAQDSYLLNKGQSGDRRVLWTWSRIKGSQMKLLVRKGNPVFPTECLLGWSGFWNERVKGVCFPLKNK